MIDWIAKNELRFKRGDSWLVVFRSIALIALVAKTWGWPDWSIPILGVSYIFGAWVLGSLDEKYGVWKAENERAMELNPYMQKLKEGIEKPR